MRVVIRGVWSIIIDQRRYMEKFVSLNKTQQRTAGIFDPKTIIVKSRTLKCVP